MTRIVNNVLSKKNGHSQNVMTNPVETVLNNGVSSAYEMHLKTTNTAGIVLGEIHLLENLVEID